MAENTPTKTPIVEKNETVVAPAQTSEVDRTPVPKEKPQPGVSFNAAKGGSKSDEKTKESEASPTPVKEESTTKKEAQTQETNESVSSKEDSPARLILDVIDIHEKVPSPLDAGYAGVKNYEDALYRENYYADYPEDSPYSEYLESLVPYYEATGSGERAPGSKVLKKATGKVGASAIAAGLGRDYGLSDQVINGMKQRFNIASRSIKEWSGVDLGQVDVIKDTGTLHGVVLHGGLPIVAGVAGGLAVGAAVVGAPAVIAGLGVGALVAAVDAATFIGAEEKDLEDRNSILSVVFPDLETVKPDELEDASPFRKWVQILKADAQDYATFFGAGKVIGSAVKGSKKGLGKFFKGSVSPQAHMKILEESGEAAQEAFVRGNPSARDIIRNERLIEQLKKIDDHVADVNAARKVKEEKEVLERINNKLGTEEIPVIKPDEKVLGKATQVTSPVKPDLRRRVAQRVDGVTENPGDINSVRRLTKSALTQMRDPDSLVGTVKDVDSGLKQESKAAVLGSSTAEELVDNPPTFTGARMSVLFSEKTKAAKARLAAAKDGLLDDALDEAYAEADQVLKARITQAATQAGGDLNAKKLFDQLSGTMETLEQSILRDTMKVKNLPSSKIRTELEKNIANNAKKLDQTIERLANIEKLPARQQKGAYQVMNLAMRSYVQYALGAKAVLSAIAGNTANLTLDGLQLVARDPLSAPGIIKDSIGGGMDAFRGLLSNKSWAAFWDEMTLGKPMSKQHRYDLEPLNSETSWLMKGLNAAASTSTTMLSVIDSAMTKIGNGINTRNALYEVVQKLPYDQARDPKILSQYLRRLQAGDPPPEVVDAFIAQRQKLIYSQQYRANKPNTNHLLSNMGWGFHQIAQEARLKRLTTESGQEANDLIGYGIASLGGLFSRVSANAIEAGLRHTHLGSLTSIKYWQNIISEGKGKEFFVDDFLIRKNIGTLGVLALANGTRTEIDKKDKGKLPTGYAEDNRGARIMGYKDYLFIGDQRVDLAHLGRVGDGFKMVTRAKEALARASLSHGWDGVGEESASALTWFVQQTAKDTALFTGFVPLLAAIGEGRVEDYAGTRLHGAQFTPGADLIKRVTQALNGKKQLWSEMSDMFDPMNVPVSYDHFGRPADSLPLTEMGLISGAASFLQLDHVGSFFAPPEPRYTKTDHELHKFLLKTGGYESSSKWWYLDKEGDYVFTPQSVAFTALRGTMKPIGRSFNVGAGVKYPLEHKERNALRSLVALDIDRYTELWEEWRKPAMDALKRNPRHPLLKAVVAKFGSSPDFVLRRARSALRPIVGNIGNEGLDVAKTFHSMAYDDLSGKPWGNEVRAITRAIKKHTKTAAAYKMLDEMDGKGREEFFENIARRIIIIQTWDILRKVSQLYTPPSVIERILEDSAREE